MTVRVILVDDQPLLRLGFRMVLGGEPDIDVIGEASDGAAAVRLTEELAPDVVLMDVRMPGMDGVEATRQIVAVHSPARVLILTTFDFDEYAFAGLRAGASGFLLKNVPPAELCNAIRAVASGDAVVSPRITRRLLDRYSADLHPADEDADIHPLIEGLTEREREVLLEVAAGLSNAEIAEKLVLSEATVKTHITRILGKLGLRDRVQAAVFAYRHGIVRP
ncbi:MAG TPA: response regulator transcription factor [Frankiaceae bacterium]|nr:response regulator transcription factor [Frankiaceae bacterium]